VLLALILWTIVTAVPFVMMILLSLRDNNDVYAHPLGIGGTYHPENFAVAWLGPEGSAGMSSFFLNSIVAVAVSLVVNLALGTVAGYYVIRLPQRVRTVYLSVFLLGSVVPFVLLLIPYYVAFNALSILSMPWAIGIAYGVLGLPTTVLVLSAFFSDFPTELVEAGQIDGLGDFSAFRRVVLPLSRGALAAVGLLEVIGAWGETQLAFVLLQDAGSQTVAIGVLGFQGRYISQLGPLFAGLTLAAIPVIVLYLIFHRFITKGIALGGVFR
jgi:ABC-type glycerol-3-phosphate transport system permease component